ncbi:MAG: hypothetical protein WAU32_14755 [Thermoanaerobaculia bacterium]
MSFPHLDDELVDGEGLELPTRFRQGEPGAKPGIDLEQLEKIVLSGGMLYWFRERGWL